MWPCVGGSGAAGDTYQYDVPALARILDRLENLSG
jgi:hypothetical protein